jgi:hypothetical protein
MSFQANASIIPEIGHICFFHILSNASFTNHSIRDTAKPEQLKMYC